MHRYNKKPKLRLLPGWRFAEVTERMHKTCELCKECPKTYRFTFTEQGLSYPVTHMYCVSCAMQAMHTHIQRLQLQIEAVQEVMAPYLNKQDSAKS